MKKTVPYVEPADYFPEKIRKKMKLGEYDDCKNNEEEATGDLIKNHEE